MTTLIEKLHSMRFSKQAIEDEIVFATRQFIYGYTECINELLIWANKEQPEITDEEREAVEFISENPDCNEYWRKHVKEFLGNEGEPDDDSCKLADEWQEQFEIAIKYLQKRTRDQSKKE